MKLVRIAVALIVLIAPLFAQQVNQDIVPASPGLNLGHSNQRWNAFITNLDIQGTCTLNGVSCAGSGGSTTPAQTTLLNCSSGTTLNEGVELSTQVVGGVTTLCGRTSLANSTSVVGICTGLCGTSGSANVAYTGYALGIIDNQTVQGDYVIPSATAGWFTDIGTSKPAGTVELFGIVASTNSGTGTVANILISPLSLYAPGSSSSAGTVSNCGNAGAIAYYSATGTTVVCGSGATLDAFGNATLNSVTLPGSGTGVITMKLGTTPSAPSAGLGSLYINSGTNSLSCLLNGGGNCLAGSSLSPSILIPTAAQTAPPGANATLGPSTNGNNPAAWAQNGDGTYDTLWGIDTYCDNTNGPPCRSGANSSGTPIIYKRLGISNSKVSPLAYKNSMFSVNSVAGTQTVASNQDRAISFSLVTPSGDTATRYGLEGIQGELDINGSPNINGSPDGEATTASFQLSDNHTGTPTLPNLGTSVIRAHIFRQAGVGQWGSCTVCWVGLGAIAQNNSTAAGGSEFMAAIQAYCNEQSGSPSGIICAAISILTPNAFSTNYGIYLGGTGPSTGSNNRAIRSDWTQLSTFAGPVTVAGNISATSGPVSGNWQCTNVTPVTVSANVATDQTLMACTIPAGTLNSVGRTLRIFLAGVYSTEVANGSTIRLKVKLCTVSGCGSGTVITPISIVSGAQLGGQTTDAFNVTAMITTQTAGASSAYEAHGNMALDGITGATVDSVYADTNTATVGTIDSTAQLFLQVTGTFSVAGAAAGNIFVQRQFVVDSVN